VTYFHYYATTSRNLDRVLQYGVFPASLLASYAFTKDIERAKTVARVVSAGFYSAMTTGFLGLEAELIDANSREAVAAEMGVDPNKLKFSDFKYSKNAIVSRAYSDVVKLQPWRYGTDLMFLLPIAAKWASKATNAPWLYEIKGSDKGMGVGTNNLWDFAVLGGKAGYWAGETYFVEKTGNYEVVKLRENLQSTGKDLTVNDLLGVYQRTRTDRKLEMISHKEEYDALRPLLKRIADAYNQHNDRFGISEIVYLIGLNKVSIHEKDGKTFSQDAVKKSEEEIERVISIGLDGIRKENQRKREAQGLSSSYEDLAHSKSFVDKVGDRAVDTIQAILGRKPKKRPEEYISVRDPGELTNWNYTANR
jgi:hypothetical protein